MRSEVIDNDKGMKKIFGEIEAADNAYTEIGVHSGETNSEGTSMVLIAASNEYGTEDGRIPERSYMRSTFDENKSQLGEVQKKQYQKVLDGKSTIKDALSILGMWFETKVKKKIIDLKDPPNAESTIARKGSSNPLVDEGQLHESIRYRVKV